jgi:hypothetical protein
VDGKFAAAVEGDICSDEALDVTARDVADAKLGVADGVVMGDEPADAAVVDDERENWDFGVDCGAMVCIEVMTWVVTTTEPFASVVLPVRDVVVVWVDGAKAPDRPMELELKLSPLEAIVSAYSLSSHSRIAYLI